MILFNYTVFYMFQTLKCPNSGRLVHEVLWYVFMHPYKQSGRRQDDIKRTAYTRMDA